MAIHGKASFLLPCLSIVILFAGLAFPEPACAQVVTDGSLGGPKGPVGSGTIPGVGTTTYHITDSLGKRAGQNLFHSFSTFNVGTGESATFTGPGGIQNIVSRVTGGSNSWIDGTLRSTIQGANLYFLNPWGIVFGPNASLDVRGSFHVSTADYLRFEDGLRFSSVPSPADQVLSTASPVAFGFLNANPAPVYVAQSFLEVPAGETLSIISGEIDLYGAYLRAPGGQINLASMSSPGEVIPSSVGNTPDLLVQPGRASGPIGVHGSVVDVRGTPSGTVLIRSGRLVLDQVSWVTADNYGDTGGGSIDARVESLDVLGESGLSADTYGGAQSGGVHIVTGSLEISQGGFVSSDSQGSGTGGPVTIEATESVHLSDSLSRVSSAGWASGDAGTVALTTPDLLMENEALIFGDSSGGGKGGDVSILTGKLRLLSGSAVSSDSLGPTGNGGNLFISATESIDISGTGPSGLPSRVANRTAGAGNAGRIEVVTPILSLGDSATIGAETIGAGRAGDIDITVGILNLTGGGMMSNSAFGTTGTGGNITIRASDSVMISGSSPLGIWSGLFSYAWWEGQGDAGNISVSTPNLTLSNLGSIGADTVGDARGGNIELAVQRLSLSDGGNISSGSHGGSGRGGDIHVSASDKVILSGLDSKISASTAGFGDGGNITISANTLTLEKEGAIFADTLGSGQGGNLGVNVTSLSMTGGSRISSNNYGGTGHGGRVMIQADKDISLTGSTTAIASGTLGSGTGGDTQLRASELRLAEGAQITAISLGTGDAGNIDIAVTGSFISRNGNVNTSSDNADGGNVHITAPYMVYLKDSEITASVGGGASTVGGNILIDPQYVILDHSRIIANAYEGQGGNIQIVSNVFLADPYSVVDASSALGINGTVDIRAPITEISGTLVPLGEDFISAFELLREPCMARIRGGKYSSFIVSGRDGLPVEPGGWLPSPMP